MVEACMSSAGSRPWREDAPRITKSMRVAQQDLRLDRLFVVYPGERRHGLDEGIECVPLTELAGAAAPIRWT